MRAIADVGGVHVRLGDDNVVFRRTRGKDLLGGSNHLIAGLELIVSFGCIEPGNHGFARVSIFSRSHMHESATEWDVVHKIVMARGQLEGTPPTATIGT